MNSEKKSSKKPANFCDLPIEIVEMIVDILDLPRRVIISRVCKTLRKMVNQQEPPRCNDLKITIGSAEGFEVKLEGFSIKYEKPRICNEYIRVHMMVDKMLNDLPIFIPNFELNSLTLRFNDNFCAHIFEYAFFKQFGRGLEVQKLVVKAFDDGAAHRGTGIVRRENLRVREIHHLTKYADDIVKVRVDNLDTGDLWRAITKNSSIKYFREGQEHIYVDKLGLVPPKKRKREPVILPKPTPKPPMTTKARNSWNPYF